MPGPTLPSPPPSLAIGSPWGPASQSTEQGKEGCGQWGWGGLTLSKWGLASVDAIKPPCIFSWVAFQDGGSTANQ